MAVTVLGPQRPEPRRCCLYLYVRVSATVEAGVEHTDAPVTTERAGSLAAAIHKFAIFLLTLRSDFDIA